MHTARVIRVCALAATASLAALTARAQVPGAPPRMAQLRETQLTPAQAPLAADILKVSSVGIGGPYNLLLRSPELGTRIVSLLDYLRFNTSVPRRLNEFAILIQSRLWTSQVEWQAHYPLALKAGLAAHVADDLKAGRRPAGMQDDEAAVYDLCMELSTTHQVSDATYRRAAALFTEQQIVDLVSVSGTYVSLAMLMNATNQSVPQGVTPPLEPLANPPAR
jgi:4-carboxymuconolactone decarboxylase